MSETASAARGGEFATSRRGGIAEDYDFIMRKALAGVPASAIARMVARSVDEVRQVIALNAQAIEPRASAFVPPARKKPAKPLPWRQWKPRSRVSNKRPLPPFARSIVEQVAARYEYTLEDVIGRRKFGNLPDVRNEAYHALYKAGRGYSYPLIASWFDGRDHSTVHSGVRKHSEILAEAEAASALEMAA